MALYERRTYTEVQSLRGIGFPNGRLSTLRNAGGEPVSSGKNAILLAQVTRRMSA
jgi:hypothetical protein